MVVNRAETRRRKVAYGGAVRIWRVCAFSEGVDIELPGRSFGSPFLDVLWRSWAAKEVSLIWTSCENRRESRWEKASRSRCVEELCPIVLTAQPMEKDKCRRMSTHDVAKEECIAAEC